MTGTSEERRWVCAAAGLLWSCTAKRPHSHWDCGYEDSTNSGFGYPDPAPVTPAPPPKSHLSEGIAGKDGPLYREALGVDAAPLPPEPGGHSCMNPEMCATCLRNLPAPSVPLPVDDGTRLANAEELLRLTSDRAAADGWRSDWFANYIDPFLANAATESEASR